MQCYNYCHLIDLGFKGRRFIWTNGRHNGANILERIDRVMANYNWLNLFPEAMVTHLPRTHSDHCPIKLELQYRPLPRKKYFALKQFGLHILFSLLLLSKPGQIIYSYYQLSMNLLI